jgi:ATP-binding cassette, subfamily B, bacterial HlyB/CyaB
MRYLGEAARFGRRHAAMRGAAHTENEENGPSIDGGFQALAVIARLHQIATDPAPLRHELSMPPGAQPGTSDLLRAANLIGLKAKLAHSRPERIPFLPLPALALMSDGSAAIIARCQGKQVLLQRFGPSTAQRPESVSIDEFAQQWTGEVILISSRASLVGELARFDFSWFVPSLIKHRKLIGEVLLVSAFLQLFALISPLFFQVVMDKVLVHRSSATLDVLVLGLTCVVVFESVLTALRTYVFSHTTSRIDVELGSRLYRHLIGLPLSYFQSRRVGDSVARVRELEHIRSFLTGNALTLLLDLVFSCVFFAVMLLYSVPLTLIVLASLPMYAALSAAVVPVLRKRLNEKFDRGAENQALLVESITGIQTVKAGALEPQLADRWDRQLAAYVSSSFRTATLASLANEGVNLIGKLIGAATLWYGAHLVMEGQLTVGMFVAFNMFAGRVAQPVMRIAQMWSEFQQTGISVQRLGDILNTRKESPPSASAQLPQLQGRIAFDDVQFRYKPDASPVINGLSLQIRAGEVIGIVGRSGSGKSTLTKLVQRLHSPERGRVLVDGIDISLIDAAQLRRQLGVVLQENFLFQRSVRENIAISDPAAPLEVVIQAARLAGADDFIRELPQGYDTVVGEQGATLSGGQRQRIAIARALFANPRILIFDEATSALDYESESALQKNMAAICKGRTVIIIAHRLSAVRHADRIVAIDRGRIEQIGTHDELLSQAGLYAHFWALQSGASQKGGAQA